MNKRERRYGNDPILFFERELKFPFPQDLPVAVGDLVITEEDDLAKETSANNLVEEEEAEAFLFDSHLVESVDVSAIASFKTGITAASPGENLRMRALGTGDYKRSEWLTTFFQSC